MVCFVFDYIKIADMNFNHKIARKIDHTFLKPEAKIEDVKKACLEAKKFGFAAVFTNTAYTQLVAAELKGSRVNTGAAIGFPLGANKTEAKVWETRLAIKDGAQEIDMVINIGYLKDKKYGLFEQDIKSVADAAGKKAIIKVILENCLLDRQEIKKACELCKKIGVDFVKTSTGFNKSGATLEDVRLMRETVGPEMGVKAAGGIKDLATAKAFINAGATRIGTSSSVKIVLENPF